LIFEVTSHSVPMFTPISVTTDLPPISSSRESDVIDFKGRYSGRDRTEMAKDVAAFANAFGGVILVGAYEDTKTGTLTFYKPMPLEEAEQLRSDFEISIKTLCHPKPVASVVRIEIEPPLSDEPGHIVAVNVSPMPLGPVGIDCDGNRQKFRFPMRVGTHTHDLTPTELAMLMVPEIRRIAILLDQIPPNSAEVKLHFRMPLLNQMATFRQIDTLLCSASFNVDQGGLPPGFWLGLPLDAIRSVWKNRDSSWGVTIDGGLIDGDFVRR